MNMRKTLLLFLIITVIFTSSCTNPKTYDYEQKVFKDLEGLEMIFNKMMEKGGHTEHTKVQYDDFSGLLSYVNGDIYVGTLEYKVPRENKDGTYSFESFKCQAQEENSLQCQEVSSSSKSSELSTTLTLGETTDLLTNTDIDGLILYLRTQFQIGYSQTIYIGFKFEEFINEKISLVESENSIKVFVEDGLYIYENTISLSGIKLVFEVSFLGGSEPHIFEIYFDWDISRINLLKG